MEKSLGAVGGKGRPRTWWTWLTSQAARALVIGRATLSWPSKQAVKDKRVAMAIEKWHEVDDTLGIANWPLCSTWARIGSGE